MMGSSRVVRPFVTALLALWIGMAILEVLRPPLGRTPLLFEGRAARVCPQISPPAVPERFEVTSGPAVIAEAGWPAIPGRIEHDSAPAAHGLVTPHGRLVWTSHWIALLADGPVSEVRLPPLTVINRDLGVPRDVVPLVVSNGFLLERPGARESSAFRLVKLDRDLKVVADRALRLSTQQLFSGSIAHVALLASDPRGGAFVLTNPLTVSHLGPDLRHEQEPLFLGALSPSGWRVDATEVSGIGRSPGIVCARFEATARWRDGGVTGPFWSKPLLVAFDEELRPLAEERVIPKLRWQIVGVAASVAVVLALVGSRRIRSWHRIVADLAATHAEAELLEERSGTVRLMLADGPLVLAPGAVPKFLCWPWSPWAGSRSCSSAWPKRRFGPGDSRKSDASSGENTQVAVLR